MREEDKKTIKRLSLFHYILGGFSFFLLCSTLVIQWWAIFSHRDETGGLGSMKAAAEVLIAMDIFSLLFVIAEIAAGWLLANRKRHSLIFVIACLECLSVPLGTVLGIFTLITLSRESVKTLFNNGDGTPPPVPVT